MINIIWFIWCNNNYSEYYNIYSPFSKSGCRTTFELELVPIIKKHSCVSYGKGLARISQWPTNHPGIALNQTVSRSIVEVENIPVNSSVIKHTNSFCRRWKIRCIWHAFKMMKVCLITHESKGLIHYRYEL